MDYQQFKNSSHSVKKNVDPLGFKENLIQIFKKTKQQGCKSPKKNLPGDKITN